MKQVAFLGFVAGLLTSTAAAPQVYKTYRSRKGAGLSYPTIVLTILGILLWIVYGMALGLTPLVFWNGVSLCLFVTLLCLKRFHCTDEL